MINKAIMSLVIFYQLSSGQTPPHIPGFPAAPAEPGPTAVPMPIEPAPPVPVVPVSPFVPAEPAPVIPLPLPILIEPVPPVSVPPVSLPPYIPGAPTVPVPPVSVPPVVPVRERPAPPAGYEYGAFGQHCAVPSSVAQCQTTSDIVSDAASPGFTRCDKTFDCCLCQAVTCTNCDTFSAGYSGVFGVQNININGKPAYQGGARIKCLGVEGCAETVITGNNIKTLLSSGVMALRNAKVTITDPVRYFELDCLAMGGCQGLKVELIYSAPPAGYACSVPSQYLAPSIISGIQCSGQESCTNMELTIRNEGCNQVIIQDLVCLRPGACNHAVFNFIGDVELQHCDLGPGQATITGIDKCYENLPHVLCPDPHSCVGAQRTLVNPIQGFKMNCGGQSACAGSRFTLELRPGAPGGFVEHLDGFWFTDEYAAAGATIVIDNQQGGAPVVIERIECATKNSCAGLTFIIGMNVDVNDIECSTSDSCGGCRIKYDAADAGIPCDPSQI